MNPTLQLGLRWAGPDWQFVSYPQVPYWALPNLKKLGLVECRRIGRRSQWRLTEAGVEARAALPPAPHGFHPHQGASAHEQT